MYPYAQTNIQLYNQLHREGYSNEDIQLIAKAYALVIDLFTGQFRSSGKTFIAHLVGTASILVSLHASVKIVVAGLLHAAYTQGDFGGLNRSGISKAKRQKISCIVGKDIEEYVARYTQLSWDAHQLKKISNHLETIDFIDRDVLLIRLANELEEYLDGGILYCGETKKQMYQHHSIETIVKIAEALNYPELGKEIDRTSQETLNLKIPQELCNPTGQIFSSLIVPNSCQRTFLAWFYRIFVDKLIENNSLSYVLDRLRAKLRNEPKV
jgi:(p)ppGpp synthase/HD superfamily hydrolase